jgi:histidinol-phosphate aminotransferase
MTTHTRADLERLQRYVAGRTIPGAIKLASNEVSAGPLPSVVDAIAKAAVEVTRYPDPAATTLTSALARKLDVDPGRISVGCGGVSLLYELCEVTCTPSDEVLFPWRSFEAYPILTRVVGARERRVPLTAEHALDLDALAAAITPATRLMFVCNPNNPSGTALRRAALERFLDQVPSDVLVVLDEAYREFVTDKDVPDGLELAAERDNVVVLRSFSKAYGLAGLRVGYCVASEEVTTTLRKVRVPFSVNALAQVAAIASLAAHDEMLARCAEVVAERERVHADLVRAGYGVPETQANFVWLPLGERTEEFNEHCLEQKVVVRAFSPDGVRVTIGTAEENDTFLAAAHSFPR